MKCPECTKEMRESSIPAHNMLNNARVIYALFECLDCGIRYKGELERKDYYIEIPSSK